MALTVKAYFEKNEGVEPEIRRFAIDQDVASNYDYFVRKVNQVFPGLESQPYRLYWKDAEDDYIAFSSDDELMQALGTMQGDIFKIYIRVLGETKTQGRNEGESHPGVTCDGCEQPVCGIRFKCLECPDYDLCSQCEGNGMHSEHQMLRICTPRTPWRGFPPPPPMFFDFGPLGHHHGHHHPPPPPPPPHGPPHHGPHRRPHHPPWMQHIWSNLFSGVTPGQQQQQQSGSGEEATKGNSAQASASAEGAQAEQAANSASDYLRRVGEAVATMLDPLGIDVAVDIEHGDQRERCGHKKETKAKDGKDDKETSATQATPVSKEVDDKQDTDKQETGKQETETDVEMTDADVQEKPQPDGETQNMAVSGNSSKSSENENGWTLINEPAVVSDGPEEPSAPPSDAETQTKAPSDGTSLYPQLTAEHSDPKIANALRQMKAMGFSDDGGWLTRLLEDKKGDIGQVLDVIHPNRPR